MQVLRAVAVVLLVLAFIVGMWGASLHDYLLIASAWMFSMTALLLLMGAEHLEGKSIQQSQQGKPFNPWQ